MKLFALLTLSLVGSMAFAHPRVITFQGDYAQADPDRQCGASNLGLIIEGQVNGEFKMGCVGDVAVNLVTDSKTESDRNASLAALQKYAGKSLNITAIVDTANPAIELDDLTIIAVHEIRK